MSNADSRRVGQKMSDSMDEPAGKLQMLRSLRAVRAYSEDPVDEASIEAILDVARWTGSAMNEQPWELIVVQNRETLRQLSVIAPGNVDHAAGAAFAIVVVLPGRAEMREAYDDGRLSERLMLAAHALGIGSCIGWFNSPAISAAAKELLGIPAERRVRTEISFGYPAASAPRRARTQARKPTAETVSWERFGQRRS